MWFIKRHMGLIVVSSGSILDLWKPQICSQTLLWLLVLVLVYLEADTFLFSWSQSVSLQPKGTKLKLRSHHSVAPNLVFFLLKCEHFIILDLIHFPTWSCFIFSLQQLSEQSSWFLNILFLCLSPSFSVCSSHGGRTYHNPAVCEETHFTVTQMTLLYQSKSHFSHICACVTGTWDLAKWWELHSKVWDVFEGQTNKHTRVQLN